MECYSVDIEIADDLEIEIGINDDLEVDINFDGDAIIGNCPIITKIDGGTADDSLFGPINGFLNGGDAT